jgi:hypothetical protein
MTTNGDYQEKEQKDYLREENKDYSTINSQEDVYENSIRMEHIDSVEEMLKIKDHNEMDSRIFKNTLNISRKLKSISKKLSEQFFLNREEVDSLIYCLKFIDTLNLFMNSQSVDALNKLVYEINELVMMINTLDTKDLILKKIRYTEMTVIYFKKKLFKNLFFGDGAPLGEEIERCLDCVTSNGSFDQKMFKQMQNVFWVVQNNIEENLRKKLSQRMAEMKLLSLRSKKGRYNYYEDYDDYSDYKNFSHTDDNCYDYYENFMENEKPYNYSQNDYYNTQRNSRKKNSNYYNSDRNFGQESEGKDNEFQGKVRERKFSYSRDTIHSNYYYNSLNFSQNCITPNNNNLVSGNNQSEDINHATSTQTYPKPTSGSTSDNKTYISSNNPQLIQTPASYIMHDQINASNTLTTSDNTVPIKKYVDDSVEVFTTVLNSNNPSSNFKKNTQNYYHENTNNYYKNYNYHKYDKNDFNSKYLNSQLNQQHYGNYNYNYNYYKDYSQNQNVNSSNPQISTHHSSTLSHGKETNKIKKVKSKKKSSCANEAQLAEEVIIKENKPENDQNQNNFISANEQYNQEQTQPEGDLMGCSTNYNMTNSEPFVEANQAQEPSNNVNNGNTSNADVTEVISVQINANKRYGSNYNHNYNSNYKNPKYGGNNYYYNNSTYTNNSNSKYFYNGVKKESYQYYENKSFPQDHEVGKEKDVTNYRNKSMKENKWDKKYYNDRNYNKYPNFKHEFVEVADPIRKQSEITQEEQVNQKKTEEPKEAHGSGSSKGEYVQIDVEKMFSNESLGEDNEAANSEKGKEEIPPILEENITNTQNCINGQQNPHELQQNPESNHNQNSQSEHSSEVDEHEDVEDLNDEDENILEAEDEDDEESEDQEMIQAEFDKFIRESNMISGNKNFNEDYYNRESDTKNNKVIFEDEVKNVDAETPVKNDKNILNCEKKEEDVIENSESDSKLKEATRNYMESLKSIDPKVILEIRDKLNEDGKKTDKSNEKSDEKNLEKQDDTENATINNITSLQGNSHSTEDFFNQRQYNKVPIQNYIFSNYAHFFYRGRDSNIHREYFALKCLEGENSSLVTKNIESFESKILIPIYQRINFNVNKKRGIYFYTYTKYKKLIYRVLTKDKILKKVKPYGSYMNNFLIDSGDIDICIVPKCGILEFSQYLEKIKEEIIGGVNFYLF